MLYYLSMPHITPEVIGAKLILRGIHLDLTEAMKAIYHEKAARLLRHEPRIDRIRLDVELDKTKTAKDHFIAHGRIEIGGPDIVASADSEDAYKSVDLLTDKLDGISYTMLFRGTPIRVKLSGGKLSVTPQPGGAGSVKAGLRDTVADALEQR